MNTQLLFMVFAFVLFVIAAFPFPPIGAWRCNLIAAGLACWVATLLFK
jgi:hypothetical protein